MNEPSLMELDSFAQSWLDEPQPSAAIFTSGPIVPETSWFTSLSQPWVDFGTGLGKAAAGTYEQLPQRLFDWGMDKLGGSESRTVPTGPGTSTTYVQPAQPGGAPADPNYIVLPPGQQAPGGIVQVPAAAGLSTLALIGIGLIIFLALRK